MSDLLEQLEGLRARVRAAGERREQAQREFDHERFTGPTVAEAEALREYGRKSEYRIAGAGDGLALKRDFARRLLEDDDVTLEPIPAQGRAVFRLTSRTLARELEEARKAEQDADWALREFEQLRADELRAVREEAERQRVASALESGDPERIREAIGLGLQKALTTSDFEGGRRPSGNRILTPRR